MLLTHWADKKGGREEVGARERGGCSLKRMFVVARIGYWGGAHSGLCLF